MGSEAAKAAGEWGEEMGPAESVPDRALEPDQDPDWDVADPGHR